MLLLLLLFQALTPHLICFPLVSSLTLSISSSIPTVKTMAHHYDTLQQSHKHSTKTMQSISSGLQDCNNDHSPDVNSTWRKHDLDFLPTKLKNIIRYSIKDSHKMSLLFGMDSTPTSELSICSKSPVRCKTVTNRSTKMLGPVRTSVDLRRPNE